MTLFGKRVRYIRIALRWTQTELGRRAGISVSQISRLETGRRPPTQKDITAIVKGFGVPIDLLVGDVVGDDETYVTRLLALPYCRVEQVLMED